MPAALSQRFPAPVGVLLTVVAGLGWRRVTGGEVAKFGGDVLYATMIYAVVRLLWPRLAVPVSAVIACLICWAVEFFQLTPWPAEASRHSVLARLILGSTFNWSDCLAYPVGVLLGLAIALAVRAMCQREGLPAVSATRN